MDSSVPSPTIAALSQSTAEPVVAPAVRGPIALSAGPAVRALGALVAFLVIASVVTESTGVADQIFALNGEQNVPTFVSSFLLLSASALLLLISVQKRRALDPYRLHWGALSAVFLFLSMDELVGFHEMSGARVEAVIATGGPFYYASTVFTGTLVLLVSALFFRFFLHLPRRFAVLFGASAALYVGGGLGVEMIGGMIDQAMGTDNVYYLLETTVEETLELSGVVLFIYALLEYARTRLGGLQLRLGAE